jgi:2-keto-3-deoxy-L-rhamnonate aldolase RhmA
MSRLDQAIAAQENKPLLGVSMHTYNPAFVEMAAMQGFRVLWAEMEHAMLSFREAADLFRIASGLGMLTFLRIPDTRRENVLRAAECGPDIIDVPMVNAPETAAELVRHARYQPQGARGFFGASRAVRYGMGGDIAEEQQRVNEALCLMIQVETLEAVERADELCGVPGIDAVFLGPGDLSVALGVTGQIGHPRVRETMERVIEVARAHGKRVAMVSAPGDAAEWGRKGADLVFCGSDIACMKTGLGSIWQEAREG